MNDSDQLTPGPWRWKFSGTAGNYFLYGNDGNGPITHTGPDCADGRLAQAAPALLAALEMVIEVATVYDNDTGELTPGQIAIRQAAKEAGMLPPAYVMQVVRGAIAEARGAE